MFQCLRNNTEGYELTHPGLMPFLGLLVSPRAIREIEEFAIHICIPKEVSNIGFITVHGLNEGHIAPDP